MRSEDALSNLDHPDRAVRREARQILLERLAKPPRNRTPLEAGLALARSVESERTASGVADLLRAVVVEGDLPRLLETHREPGWTHAVARTAIRRWMEDAPHEDAADGASVCVLWAAQSSDERLAEFVCDVILKRAASRPHASLRAVLPVLQQVANQRRLKQLRRGLGAFRAIQQDKPFGKTHDALEKLLPLRDLPIPASRSIGVDSLPRPSEPETVDPADLPTPSANAPIPRKNPWWRW